MYITEYIECVIQESCIATFFKYIVAIRFSSILYALLTYVVDVIQVCCICYASMLYRFFKYIVYVIHVCCIYTFSFSLKYILFFPVAITTVHLPHTHVINSSLFFAPSLHFAIHTHTVKGQQSINKYIKTTSGLEFHTFLFQFCG